VNAEVAIADIASADDPKAPIRDEYFVVHAVIELRDPRYELERPSELRANAPRIEHTHLDARVRAERFELRVASADCEVVQQKAASDTTVGRFDHVPHQLTAGHVVLPDEVLDIQRLLGKARKREAYAQRIGVVVEQPEGGLPV